MSVWQWKSGLESSREIRWRLFQAQKNVDDRIQVVPACLASCRYALVEFSNKSLCRLSHEHYFKEFSLKIASHHETDQRQAPTGFPSLIFVGQTSICSDYNLFQIASRSKSLAYNIREMFTAQFPHSVTIINIDSCINESD